ncbi:MAG: pyridoxal-phosphate dependent enzyme, partial [Bdellovibrionales bacterium]|nr:pyridoxal-phosphate dependent enzyme [Bdellovibrionales bacterium]
MLKVSFSDIQRARDVLASYIKPSSLSKSDSLSEEIGTKLFFKWESDHRIKSFKIRGALNKVLSLSEAERKKGLITVSAGNHAQGVALASQWAGVKARVVMMETASKVKIKATESFGAEVILKGKNYDTSYALAESLRGDSLFIHPFADPLIIAGQGTTALEVFQTLPEVTSVVVAIGGGGLVSGVSLALKHLKPSCRVYGVVWDGTPAQCRNFHKVGEE